MGTPKAILANPLHSTMHVTNCKDGDFVQQACNGMTVRIDWRGRCGQILRSQTLHSQSLRLRPLGDL